MGLLSGLVLLPLAPLRFTGWVAGQIAEVADQELYGPEALLARLAELHRALEAGEIGHAAFEREEERVLVRLQRIRGPGSGPTHRDDGEGTHD
ncbi:gas vesicle protein GvpG [Streptomyces hoynatensis]|uniref:Gas vesicle protein n=1 Tax=Streptomyces hoynatensis TaxID=1141874 RepID=A0A3A9YYD5_9ACTN|nr:gas vesicle protein GvpG [Streptomyces hoynatensis]RKN40910.1 gas vesicle protein [Streptomyces hoynatensis]